MQKSKELTLTDNIKHLFAKVEKKDKKDFIKLVANHFQLKESTVRINWFTRFEIPSLYNVQENLVNLMQKYISNKY
jgi:ketosteroid isomerase-like protein